jgi:hypothetical protein
MPVIATRKVWRINDDGSATALASISVEVWNVSSNSLQTTVTTDASGNFPATTVPGAVGDKFRLRVTNDGQGRADSVTVLSE